MKNFQFTLSITVLLVLSPLISSRWQDNTQPQGLSSHQINTIFDNADKSRSGSLYGQNLRNALTEAVSAIFATNNYYDDKPMIDAIAQDLLQSVGSQVSQDSFRNFVANVPSTVKNFREKIFNHLLDLYDVNDLMDDRDIAKEVIQKPDTFGLSYSAYKVLTFRFEDDGAAASNYANTKSRYESMRDSGYGNQGVNRDIREEIERISNAFNERPSEIIGSTGIDTFDENARNVAGKRIEVEETITQRIEAGVIRGNSKDGLDGEYVSAEARAQRKYDL